MIQTGRLQYLSPPELHPRELARVVDTLTALPPERAIPSLAVGVGAPGYGDEASLFRVLTVPTVRSITLTLTYVSWRLTPEHGTFFKNFVRERAWSGAPPLRTLVLEEPCGENEATWAALIEVIRTFMERESSSTSVLLSNWWRVYNMIA